MNNEAVLRLFDTYADDAFRLAYSYLGSRPDAEDVVQDVFVKLIRSDITITRGKEKSYILTMTANRCRDFLKSADVVYKAPFEDAADVGSDIEIDEDDTEMFEAVSELPEKLRVAIHLHYVQQQYLPNDIKNKRYYTFGDSKLEMQAKAYFDMIRQNTKKN